MDEQLNELKAMMGYDEVSTCVDTIVKGVQHIYGETPIEHTQHSITIYDDEDDYMYPMIDGALSMYNYTNKTHISFDEEDIQGTRTIKIFTFEQVR